MRKIVMFVLCLVFVFTLVTFADCATDKTYRLKVGMVVTEQDPMYQGALALKKGVESRTNGKLIIEIYPSSQLGDTQDVQEAAKAGANVAALTDAGRLAEFVPEIGILGAPYIVESFEEGTVLLQSDLFKGWADKLAKDHGLKILSFNWYQGDRHVLAKKPVYSPKDLNRLRIRTPGSPVWMETVKAMGGNPTPLAWAEVYPGLQQGVIDGLEAQLPAVFGASLYEVITHITKTAHFQLITGLVTGTAWFDSLPQEYQDILVDEAWKAGMKASQITIDSLNDYEEQMKAKGVIFVEIDKTPFIEATDKVYDVIKGYREIRNQVNQVLGK